MKSYRTSAAILLAWVFTLMAAPCGFAQPAFPPAPAPSAPPPFPPGPPGPTNQPGPPGSLAAPQPAGAPATVAPLIQAEGNERFTLNFRNMPIEEVFTFLSRRDKVNIIVGKGVSGQVSVNLYGVTLKEAIQNVASAAGYAVEMRNGDYVILTKEPGIEPAGPGTQIKTLKVQYSDTRQIADLLTKHLSRHGKITPLLGRKLVVVEDLPASIERIERLLEQLDIQPKQIMIEAKILEITLDENERFGIDWRRLFSTTIGSSSGPASIGTSGLVNRGDPGTPATPTVVSPGGVTILGTPGTPAVPAASGFFFSLLNSRIDLFFSALATAGRVRTLSTPKLLALENQESTVTIGDSTGYKVTTTINLVTTETIQFLESGVILKVIPSVDQRGRVLLKIQPEVSSASVLAGIPSKKKTQVTTELIVDDGQSIFIGGLIKARGTTERDGVPLLKDLPVLGRLFSSTFDAVSMAETVVIITPHIVSQPSDLARESEEKVRQAQGAFGLILDHQLRLERGRPIP